MAGRPVQAVWVWRYTKAPFKATYGRRAGTTYSKDFLQASGECSEALDRVFNRIRGGRVELRFEWPGGHRVGSLFEAADFEENGRLELRWETNNAPAPWRLYRDEDPNPLKAFPGDPTHSTAVRADQEFEAFRGRNLDPWLVVVKLFGEDALIHVRAYLGMPTTALANTSTSLLPPRVRAVMARVPTRGGCAAYVEDERALAATGGMGMLFDPARIHDAWIDVDAARFLEILAEPVPRARRPPAPRRFSGTYRPANVAIRTAQARVFTRDPDEVDRALRGHHTTQEALADRVSAAGMTPGSSIDPACDYDLAWQRNGIVYVTEVKSLTDQNERLQLRLGIGQVLDYAHRLRAEGWDVQPVLAVEKRPSGETWIEICDELGIQLVWPETMSSLFD